MQVKVNLFAFFSVYFVICALFARCIQFMFKHNNSSHMQTQEWEHSYD